MNNWTDYAGAPFQKREDAMNRIKELEKKIELVEATVMRIVATMNKQEGSSISWTMQQQLKHGGIFGRSDYIAFQERFHKNELRIHNIETVLIETLLKLNDK
ncbi:MAG: hypothetical protein JJE29_00415 [Peptostreptococcaceae bacterium]|nr:hypothetical protein [Peptostreptococcaceae bacterium]